MATERNSGNGKTDREDRPKPGEVDEQDTTQAEEWGERIDTGWAIARGGKEKSPPLRDGKEA